MALIKLAHMELLVRIDADSFISDRGKYNQSSKMVMPIEGY
jgi:hypothetical protein